MKSRIFIYGLVLTFLISCTERIELELEEGYTRLVVEGEITTDSLHHAIKLSKTSSYFHNRQAPEVSGAVVSISDGTRLYNLNEVSPGTYLTEMMAGEPGKSYTLNIDLPEEINGHTNYTATAEMMPVYPVDSIGLMFIPQWEIWEVKLFAQEPPERNFYMFRLMINNQLVTDTINEINVSDDRLFNGNYSNGMGVAWLNADEEGEKLLPGDKITLILSTITEDYANFLWELQSETGYNNPLFGGPPANINGNISNGAIGFFAAHGNVYTSTLAPAEPE